MLHDQARALYYMTVEGESISSMWWPEHVAAAAADAIHWSVMGLHTAKGNDNCAS